MGVGGFDIFDSRDSRCAGPNKAIVIGGFPKLRIRGNGMEAVGQSNTISFCWDEQESECVPLADIQFTC